MGEIVSLPWRQASFPLSQPKPGSRSRGAPQNLESQHMHLIKRFSKVLCTFKKLPQDSRIPKGHGAGATAKEALFFFQSEFY